MFTHWIDLPSPTIVTYSISSTILAAPDAATAIPGLKVEVNGERVSALYAHTVTLSCARGSFVDHADVAIVFPKQARIYGHTVAMQSSLQSISCSDMEVNVEKGLRCALSPISPGENGPSSFFITISSDELSPPRVELLGKNLRLLSSDKYLGNQAGRVWFSAILGGMVGTAMGTLGVLIGSIFTKSKS